MRVEKSVAADAFCTVTGLRNLLRVPDNSQNAKLAALKPGCSVVFYQQDAQARYRSEWQRSDCSGLAINIL